MLCRQKLWFDCQSTAPSLRFNAAIQHLRIPFFPSLLRHSPAGVLWMWMASFSRSSSGHLARSITEMSSKLMGWRLPQVCSATADFCREWFGMHPGVPSAWFPVFAWSRRCRLCQSCRVSGTLRGPASPLVEHPSPWSTLIRGSGWIGRPPSCQTSGKPV